MVIVFQYYQKTRNDEQQKKMTTFRDAFIANETVNLEGFWITVVFALSRQRAFFYVRNRSYCFVFWLGRSSSAWKCRSSFLQLFL